MELPRGCSGGESGEEDMIENVPSLGPTVIQSSLNGPSYNGGSSIRVQYNFPAGQRIDMSITAIA